MRFCVLVSGLVTCAIVQWGSGGEVLGIDYSLLYIQCDGTCKERRNETVKWDEIYQY